MIQKLGLSLFPSSLRASRPGTLVISLKINSAKGVSKMPGLSLIGYRSVPRGKNDRILPLSSTNLYHLELDTLNLGPWNSCQKQLPCLELLSWACLSWFNSQKQNETKHILATSVYLSILSLASINISSSIPSGGSSSHGSMQLVVHSSDDICKLIRILLESMSDLSTLILRNQTFDKSLNLSENWILLTFTETL